MRHLHTQLTLSRRMKIGAAIGIAGAVAAGYWLFAPAGGLQDVRATFAAPDVTHAAQPATLVGQRVPPVGAFTTVGHATDDARWLSDADLARGEPIVLHFFAIWCAACMADWTALEALAGEGVDILGVAYRDSAERVRELSRSPFSETWLDPRAELGNTLRVAGLPETLILDGDGVIVAHHRGPIDLETVDAILGPALRGLR